MKIIWCAVLVEIQYYWYFWLNVSKYRVLILHGPAFEEDLEAAAAVECEWGGEH